MPGKTYQSELQEEIDAIRSGLAAPENQTVPIRDAATLVLLRHEADTTRVLLGKRSNKHQFLPDLYVFPGGRVDEGDEMPPSLSEPGEACQAALELHGSRPARAFGLTTIRETFEETGLLVGKSGLAPTHDLPESWRTYFNHGVTPCLQGLTYIGRAVTPPGPPRRFDTRFLLADAETVLIDDRPPLDGAELHDLQWFPIEDARQMALPLVTRFVLEDIVERMSGNIASSRPFNWFWSDGEILIDRL